MELTKKHIVFTLGVSIPLNESFQYNKQLESKILYEHLLYESFLNSIKQYAQDKFNTVVNTIKDWKDAATVIGKVLSDADLLDNFLACTTTWDGLRPTCQDCLKKQRVGNKERMTEYNKKCWQKTKVEQSAKNKIWRESNVEHRLWITYLSE